MAGFLYEAARKALLEDGGRLIPDSIRASLGMKPAPWPFGTILRRTKASLAGILDRSSVERVRLLVVADDGGPDFSAIVVSESGGKEPGSISRAWARDYWEPE